jgi:hypothetical protein
MAGLGQNDLIKAQGQGTNDKKPIVKAQGAGNKAQEANK